MKPARRHHPSPRRGPAPLSAALFRELSARYRRLHGLTLLEVATDGTIVRGAPCQARCAETPACQESRRHAVAEALRWGEPCVNLCPAGSIIWGLPLMHNDQLTGGLVVVSALTEGDAAEGRARSAAHRIRAACGGLLELAETRNLTNSARLQLNRLAAGRERERAEAIHASKGHSFDDIRAVYLREEPALLAAIRRGERERAREIINRVLVTIYHLGGNRLDLLKSFTLELVVMMYRAAVEAGADPAGLLGVNYRSVAGLAHIEDDEALCHWLTGMLERLIDAIRVNRQYPSTVLVGHALRHMQAHLAEPLDRDGVARAAGLSPSHFSHLLRQKLGRTFTDLLAEYRINRACELLLRTPRSIFQVAAASGFQDQSYFTKVFRRCTGTTPRQYRRRHAADTPHASPGAHP